MVWILDSIDFPNAGSTKPLFYTIKWGYTNQSGYSKGDCPMLIAWSDSFFKFQCVLGKWIWRILQDFGSPDEGQSDSYIVYLHQSKWKQHSLFYDKVYAWFCLANLNRFMVQYCCRKCLIQLSSIATTNIASIAEQVPAIGLRLQ